VPNELCFERLAKDGGIGIQPYKMQASGQIFDEEMGLQIPCERSNANVYEKMIPYKRVGSLLMMVTTARLSGLDFYSLAVKGS